jgi:hypothetical protein
VSGFAGLPGSLGDLLAAFRPLRSGKLGNAFGFDGSRSHESLLELAKLLERALRRWFHGVARAGYQVGHRVDEGRSSTGLGHSLSPVQRRGTRAFVHRLPDGLPQRLSASLPRVASTVSSTV